MKILKIILSTAFILSVSLSYAQCYTDQYLEELLQSDSQTAVNYSHYLEHHMTTVMEATNSNDDAKYKKKASRVVPVVFHVIHAYGEENISKSQILEQLDILNKDFSKTNSDTGIVREIFKGVAADMDIEFKLAQIAPDGSCTDGINRVYSELTDGGDEKVKELIRWDYRKYLNIWVVKRIERNWEPPSYVLGYATLPYGTSASRDGIVIRHDRIGTTGTAVSVSRGRTLTHEVGHWVGLLHPFQGGCTTNDAWTDQVDDTPPVAEASYGCNRNANTCSNDNPDLPDQIENYMDYSNESCQSMFTVGQLARVNQFLSSGTYRGQNISSSNLSATGVNNPQDCRPIADFYTIDKETYVCESNSSLTFKDHSYRGDISSRQWFFEGGTPSTSTALEPEVSYSSAGNYDVTLIVGNGEGFDTLTRTEFITVRPTVAQIKAPFGEDFESVNFGFGWQLETSDNDGWSTFNRGSNSSNGLRCYIDDLTDQNVRFSLTMPPVDLNSHGTPIDLHFDYAYAPRSNNSSEVLLISLSEDCGVTWKTIKGLTANSGLATIQGNYPDFVPNSQSQWAHGSINIDGYASSQNIMFRFDVLSKGGNSVYLDNINLAQFGLSVNELGLSSKLNIYPNPAANKLTVNAGTEWLNAVYEVRDLSGRLILQSQLTSTDQLITVDELLNGVYMFSIEKDNIRRTEKLIINR